MCYLSSMSEQLPGNMAKKRASRVAVELIRALRGRRSRPAFSRHLGYRSNVVQRWESQVSWPTAARFFSVCERLRIGTRAAVSRFLRRNPRWLSEPGLTAIGGVSALLSDLQGQTPLRVLSERTGYNRFSISRWLKGEAMPRLPELLNLIEACTRRMTDFVAELVDPALLPSLASEWKALTLAREGAFTRPWSHAVLRALELPAPRSMKAQVGALARQTGLSPAAVNEELEFLLATGQVRKMRTGYRGTQPLMVDTGGQAERALHLKLTWVRLALERLEGGSAGHIGYSLFAVSREDMRRIRQVQLEYVRSMSSIISSSKVSECVGLYSAQLLDLAAGEENVFANHELPVPRNSRERPRRAG